MKLNLSQTLVSLTSALDFVGVDEIHHGKRVALMAGSIATELGWSDAAVRDIIYAGMLHDCGVSRDKEHRLLTATLEWEGSDEHCVRGAKYLAACSPLAHFSEVVRWHHTRWETLQLQALPDAVKLASNLLFLADRADVLVAKYFQGQTMQSELLWEYPEALARLSELQGTLFSPQFVEALSRVAQIARYLAADRGIAGEQLDMIEIAALLHDIGKLRGPRRSSKKPVL